MASKKILIISHKPPYPKLDGGSIAIAQVLEVLIELGCHVTFLCMETDKHPSKNSIINTNLNFKAIYVNTKLKIALALSNMFTKQSYILSRFNQTYLEKHSKKFSKNKHLTQFYLKVYLQVLISIQ